MKYIVYIAILGALGVLFACILFGTALVRQYFWEFVAFGLFFTLMSVVLDQISKYLDWDFT
jgi:ABC-type multidrug transport system permease subunit